MKKFKKIYIEITNICNLNCSFCPKDNLIEREMSLIEFEDILIKINDYTDFIYLHVKGEPLMHSNLEGILSLANKYNKKVNITTNGVLLKKNKEVLTNVRQINVSLQSLVNLSYIDDILDTCDYLSKKTYISYRFWTRNKLEKEILSILNKRYSIIGNKLSDNIFLSYDQEFIWPDLDNYVFKTEGSCYGLKDHIAILVDGTIVPCCLDSKGIINLGNIYTESLENIISSNRFQTMKNGFDNNILTEELCTKCGFNHKKNTN